MIKTITKRFPCIGCDENDFHLANTTFASNFTSTTYPYNNLKDSGIYGDTGGNNYARVNVDKAANSDSYLYLLFDLSEIPDYAKITSNEGNVRLYSSGTKVSYRQIRWCLDDISTPLRTSQSFSTSSNPTEINVSPLDSNLTVEQAKRVRCYVHYDRNQQGDNTQRYLYIYGACIDITYQVPVLHIKENDTWKEIDQVYKKENGIWVPKTPLYLQENNIDYLKKMI